MHLFPVLRDLQASARPSSHPLPSQLLVHLLCGEDSCKRLSSRKMSPEKVGGSMSISFGFSLKSGLLFSISLGPFGFPPSLTPPC